jgi:hypothetical protein
VKVKDIQIAIQKIKDFPETHGYTEEEAKEIEEFEKTMTEFSVKISKVFNEINEQLRKAFEPAQKAIIEFNKRVTELSYFSEYGWFVGFNIFDDLKMADLFNLIKIKDSHKVDEFFVDWFEKNKKNVFDYFINQHPKRKSQFNELEKGFKHQLYSSVIILSYSITDGITNETIGCGFFDTEKIQGEHNLIIKGHIDKKDGLLNAISSQFLKKRNELTKHYDTKKHILPKDSYNRHLVVHGHSFEYGNKINAVRALLLLDFTIYLLECLNPKE